MQLISKKVSGESVVEVMVTMAITSIILISAIVLIGRSYQTVGDTKKRIEAVALAQEGVELVRNLRDSNWLKYSGNRRANWAKLDGSNNKLNDGETEKFLKIDGSGTLVFASSGVADDYLEVFGEDGATAGSSNQLYDSAVASLKSEFGLNRASTGEYVSVGTASSTESAYMRIIKATPNEDDGQILDIDSEVYWKKLESKNFEKVKISTKLYDFYENEE